MALSPGTGRDRRKARAPKTRRTMRALVKDGAALEVRSVARPHVSSPHDVIVRVELAGVCRTDVFVAQGRLRAASPLILGHELSGRVVETGRGVRHVSEGDLVSVIPQVPCSRCEPCGRGLACSRPRRLGVDRDGAFAELLRVPAACVLRLPPTLSPMNGAYTEPVAAALAPLKTGISPSERGLIWGKNRIAELTLAVLRAHGFTRVRVHDPSREEPPESSLDYVIEAGATTGALRAIVRALRPRGRVVLRSRLVDPVSIDLSEIVPKEIVLEAAAYGSFEEAVALLSSGRLALAPLLGPARPLEEHETVLAEAARSEGKKLFFSLGDSG